MRLCGKMITQTRSNGMEEEMNDEGELDDINACFVQLPLTIQKLSACMYFAWATPSFNNTYHFEVLYSLLFVGILNFVQTCARR